MFEMLNPLVTNRRFVIKLQDITYGDVRRFFSQGSLACQNLSAHTSPLEMYGVCISVTDFLDLIYIIYIIEPAHLYRQLYNIPNFAY